MRRLAILLAVSILFAAATAQEWTVQILTPPGATRSDAYAVADGQVGGEAWFTTGAFPYVWTLDGVPTNLSTGAFGGAVYGVSRGMQVGFISGGGQWHAAMWSGTAASMVDIHPARTVFSSANDIHNGVIVG